MIIPFPKESLKETFVYGGVAIVLNRNSIINSQKEHFEYLFPNSELSPVDN